MMTVKDLSRLTGVSIRTLQFYDEIGLFRPTAVTDAGYRLYDGEALQTLQQILFFKELDFTLKEIKAMMESPSFDPAVTFQKQRELIQMKRDRLNGILELLDKRIKGEISMEFKAFDMSDYFCALSDLKKTHMEEIVQKLGSLDRFDEMIEELNFNKNEIAAMAVTQFGSLENFTKAMEKNLKRFLSGKGVLPQAEVEGLAEKTEALTKRLAADLTKDAASDEIQETVRELIAFVNKTNQGMDMGENYWGFMAENYMSNPAYIEINDRKYGTGASKFIGRAIKTHLGRQ